jgi:hypothetical protein
VGACDSTGGVLAGLVRECQPPAALGSTAKHHLAPSKPTWLLMIKLDLQEDLVNSA